jgi:hypothetical protein
MKLKNWYDGGKKSERNEKILNNIFSIAIVLLLIFFILYIKPRNEISNQIQWIKEKFPFRYSIYIFVITTVLLMVFVSGIMHEFIHILFIPDWVRSDKIYVGCFFRKRMFQGFAVCIIQPMSKMRYLIMGLAPLIFLSVIPITFMMVTPYWNFLILMVCFFNLNGSSSDIYNSYLVLKKVPKNAVIIRSYYK